MQLSAFPKGFDRHLKGSLNHTPSRGQQGAWVWIKDRYYIRTNRGTRLQALPKSISEIMKANLEKRNRTVRLIRYSLILALVAGALVMLAGCSAKFTTDSSRGVAITDALHGDYDRVNGVMCYSYNTRGLGRPLSCVKVAP